MQKSQTYDYEKNDHINRANLAILCSQYFGIKDALPSLYKIAAPVCEIPQYNKDGEQIWDREEVDEAIPWGERSLRTFGVVYMFEATASFIGIDGRTYVVPMDKPVLDYLTLCGYVIAPYGKNLDGNNIGDDTLIYKEPKKDIFDPDFNLDEPAKVIDRNLPPEFVSKIDEIEGDRPYRRDCASYIDTIRFGTSFGAEMASEEEIEAMSLSEKKALNIKMYNRIKTSMDIEEYVQYAISQGYLANQDVSTL